MDNLCSFGLIKKLHIDLENTVTEYNAMLQLIEELEAGHKRHVSIEMADKSCSYVDSFLCEWRNESIKNTLKRAEYIVQNYDLFFSMVEQRYSTILDDFCNFKDHACHLADK